MPPCSRKSHTQAGSCALEYGGRSLAHPEVWVEALLVMTSTTSLVSVFPEVSRLFGSSHHAGSVDPVRGVAPMLSRGGPTVMDLTARSRER
jgi:hypothetical protein